MRLLSIIIIVIGMIVMGPLCGTSEIFAAEWSTSDNQNLSSDQNYEGAYYHRVIHPYPHGYPAAPPGIAVDDPNENFVLDGSTYCDPSVAGNCPSDPPAPDCPIVEIDCTIYDPLEDPYSYSPGDFASFLAYYQKQYPHRFEYGRPMEEPLFIGTTPQDEAPAHNWEGQHPGPGYESDYEDCWTKVDGTEAAQWEPANEYCWDTSAPEWLKDDDGNPLKNRADPTGLGSDPLTVGTGPSALYTYGDPNSLLTVWDPDLLKTEQSDAKFIDDLYQAVYDAHSGPDYDYERKFIHDILRLWDHTQDSGGAQADWGDAPIPDGINDERWELYITRYQAWSYNPKDPEKILVGNLCTSPDTYSSQEVEDAGKPKDACSKAARLGFFPHKLEQVWILQDSTIHDEGLLPWLDRDGDSDIDPVDYPCKGEKPISLGGTCDPATDLFDEGNYVHYFVEEYIFQTVDQPWTDFNNSSGKVGQVFDYYFDHGAIEPFDIVDYFEPIDRSHTYVLEHDPVNKEVSQSFSHDHDPF